MTPVVSRGQSGPDMKSTTEPARTGKTDPVSYLTDADGLPCQQLTGSFLPDLPDQFRIVQANGCQGSLQRPRTDIKLCRHGGQNRIAIRQKGLNGQPHFIEWRVLCGASKHFDDSHMTIAQSYAGDRPKLILTRQKISISVTTYDAQRATGQYVG